MSETSSRPGQRTAELDPLGRLAVAIGRSQGSRDLAATALEILCSATGAKAGLILFNTNDGYEVGGHRGLDLANVTLIAAFRRVGARLTDALEADERPMFLAVKDAPLRDSIIEAIRSDGIEWLMLVGLQAAGRISGVVGLGWHDRPIVRPPDAMMLQAAALTGAGLENARLVERLERALAAERRRADEHAALQSLTLTAESAEQFEELATRTVNQVGDLLGASGGTYAILSANEPFVRASHVGVPAEIVTWLSATPASGLGAVARFRAGEGPFRWQLDQTTMDPARLDVIRRHRLTAGVALPIRVRDELQGILVLYFTRAVNELTFDDRTLRLISDILGISLTNFNLRERAEASESRYRALFENSPDALVLEQPDGFVVDANVAALELYRTDLDGLKVMSAKRIGWVSPDEHERRQQILRRDARATFRGTGTRPDGSTFPEEIDVAAVDISGERRYVILVRDLSERERLQQELLQAQKMEAIGQLVSGVAHELNNPLAAIIAFSQLIRSDDRLPPDLRTDADLLVQEADRTRRIVQNLLDFARQRPPERHPTRLGPLVASVLSLQSYNIAAARITIDVRVPDDLPPIEIDRGQLQQVLLNLTLNAIQAIVSTGQPGAIEIVARLVDADDGPARVQLSVSDDGPGVAEEIRSRLLMPFFTTKEPGQGTGLGLSVSFGIVAGHGGSLWFEPAEGRGATFIAELPVSASLGGRVSWDGEPPFRGSSGESPIGSGSANGPAVEDDRGDEADRGNARGAEAGRGDDGSGRSTTAGTSSGSSGSPRHQPAHDPGEAGARPPFRVLILDDEPAIRASLAKALRLGNFDPVAAADGPSAIRICEEQSFDAVLIDHRMPAMPGTEVYAAIVKLRPELKGHFLFMSGDVLNPELLTFAREHGIGLLSKPYDVETVIRAVGEVARGGEPRDWTS